MARKSTTVLSRNGGTWTEAQYFSKIRSALRSAFRYWKPITQALEKASRPYKGANKLQKKEYQCAMCLDWYKRKEVEVDHKIPCGSLRSLEDISGFIERLTAEDTNAFQCLCKQCHLEKTKQDKTK